MQRKLARRSHRRNLLSGALVVIGEVDKGLPGVLARGALAATRDGEIGFDVLRLRPVQEVVSTARCTWTVRVVVAPAGSRNWTSAAP